MKTSILFCSRTIAAILASSTIGHAATIVDVTGITGHDGGNWTATLGHLTDMVNATNTTAITVGDHFAGMSNTSDPDPANWTWTANNYQATWHANSKLDNTTSANGKIGWVVMDFGSVVSNLENMYMWASSTGQTDSGREQVRNFNIYYSSGVGINSLPAMPNSKSTTGDYNFGVGDWAQIGTTQDLGTASGAVNVVQSLGGVSARYIAIEVMSITDMTDTRMAIAQVEFTAVPEPSVALLSGLGALMLLRRKKR